MRSASLLQDPPSRSTSALAGLLVATAYIASFQSCTTTRPLPPGTIEASSAALPMWSSGETGDTCPLGNTCVVGAISGVASRDAALTGARNKAYLQLIEMAFPVDVSQNYLLHRSNDSVAVDERTQAEVFGRLQGAILLDSHWAKRMLYSADGGHAVYDGLALVAIPTPRLKELYPAELRRSAQRSSELMAQLGAMLATISGPSPASSQIAAAAAVAKEAAEVLPTLQDCKEKAQLSGQLQAMLLRLNTLVTVDLVGVEHDFQSRRVTAKFRLRAAGSVAVGVPVSVLITEPEGQGQVQSRSDSNGEFSVDLPLTNLLSGNKLAVQPYGLPAATVSVDVPPAVACAELSKVFKVSGYLSAELGGAFAGCTTGLAIGLAAALPTCSSASPSDGAATVRLEVKGSVANPTQRTAELFICGAQFQAFVAVKVGTSVVAEFSSPVTNIQAAGRNAAQLRDALDRGVCGLARSALDTVIKNIKSN